MAQIPKEENATEQHDVLQLFFNQDPHFDIRQKLYIVVALSQRKQSRLMETVGQVHCSNQPFPTWGLVGQALSKAFFNVPGRLGLKSTMELHRKNYLLFEQDFDSESVNTATVTDSVLEVYFEKRLDRRWLCYWRPARPVVVKFVKDC
jgi:hypothetical protein